MIPLISVIIPVYNQEKFITRCIRSILNQTIDKSSYEVIVIDDCSDDNTDVLLSSFKKEIKIIKNKVNKGLPASLNIGIKKAMGKYIVRLDSDDYVHTDYLKIMSMALEMNTGFDAVSCDYIKVADNEEVISRHNSEQDKIGCGIMFRQKHMIDIGLYNKDQLFNEEIEFRQRYEKKYKIIRLPFTLYRYRMHETNMTKDKENMDLYLKKIKAQKNDFRK